MRNSSDRILTDQDFSRKRLNPPSRARSNSACQNGPVAQWISHLAGKRLTVPSATRRSTTRVTSMECRLPAHVVAASRVHGKDPVPESGVQKQVDDLALEAFAAWFRSRPPLVNTASPTFAARIRRQERRGAYGAFGCRTQKESVRKAGQTPAPKNIGPEFWQSTTLLLGLLGGAFLMR